MPLSSTESVSHRERSAGGVGPGVLVEESHGLVVLRVALLVGDTRDSQRAGRSRGRFQPVRESAS